VVPRENGSLPPEVRWGVGCLVAFAAIIGTLVLVFLISFALEPPAWLQVVIGVALAVGGAFFAWLVASGLGGHKERG
jgi:phosphate/sulfate permease